VTDQPLELDALMTKLGLSNADLVNASTEQLSFKNVQKGRTGRHLTPNIQDKILAALTKLKPELKLRKRNLFRYEASPAFIEKVQDALARTRSGKIVYPQFVDLLADAGVIAYMAEVGPNRVTFYAYGGEAHMEQGPEVSADGPGRYGEASLKSAIADAQKKLIDHPTFLKRIHNAGIATYEVNVRKRLIQYKGLETSYKEVIPEYVPASKAPAVPAAAPAAPAAPAPAADAKPKLSNKKRKAALRLKKKKKPGIVRTTRKKRMTLNKLYRAKKRKARQPKRTRVRSK
jgi:uncharacterized protein YbcV (DUF1398 family)